MNSNEIGSIIKYHRQQSGLSQQELARVAGVGKTVIYDIEKGKETIKLNSLMKVIEVLDIKLRLDAPTRQEGVNE
jgi:HTH-type transcriptional regulator/antitoxin HipB